MASNLISQNSDLKRKLSVTSSDDIFTATASSTNNNHSSEINRLTANDIWNEILEGKKKKEEKIIITLEDYLVNAGAMVKDEQEKDDDFNINKRSLSLIEPLDKVSQQRQRRMIKNRESAARSRERKQAYQVELELIVMKLEEENERLVKEKEERAKKRLGQLLEYVIPVVEKRKPLPCSLRRVRSMQW